MASCVFRYCKNTTRNVDESSNVSFHRFVHPGHAKREEWIKIIRKDRSEKTWLPSKHSLVCSAHFKADDFYITKTKRRFLKKSAIPCSDPSEQCLPEAPTYFIEIMPISDTESRKKQSNQDAGLKKRTKTLTNIIKQEPLETSLGSSAPAISIVKTETLDEPSTSDDFGDPPETGCESPSGLSDIGSDDLEGALDTPLVLQLKQQLQQKDQIIKENIKKIKEKDDQMKAKDEKIEQLQNAVTRLGARNKTMKLILAKMRRRVLGKNLTTDRIKDVADADNSTSTIPNK